MLYPVKGKDGNPPTLAEAAEQLGVPIEKLDPEYGVRLADFRKDVYAVQNIAPISQW